MSRKGTHLFYHPLSLKHDTGAGHPERIERVQAITDRLEKTGLKDECEWTTPEPASIELIRANHSGDYIDSIKRVANAGGGPLDADTVISEKSYEAALTAAGACTQAVDSVLEGCSRNAFCLNRPPGHHARRSTAMGFCLFNNIAIGARHALLKQGLERVFIFDWDVHHGNGTQESFYSDPSVFFCSIHQSPLYPGTGTPNEIGGGAGEGSTLNLPVLAGADGKIYESLLEESVLPAIHAFQPELIMISAGFDAHRRDPLAGVLLTDEDFGMLAKGVLKAADSLCDGKVVSVLEGGYDLEGLSGGVEQLIRAQLAYS
jgi:acetoin utilization deacetylase AcuC-like enzyme